MRLFPKIIYKEHDYTRLNEGFNKVVAMIENSNLDTFESTCNYADLWVDFIAFDEGFYQLDKWYNILFAKLVGTYGYHQRFCDSINFRVDVLKNMLDEKEENLHSSSKKIGFHNHK